MATEHIVALLIAERDKLNRAIEALGGAPTLLRRGRPKATAAPALEKSAGMSAAKRKEQSERMKAYWAKKRKAKSSS